jgi:hypothetical protein
VAMLFPIALAARTWVKSQEPTATAIRRRDETMAAWNALKGAELTGSDSLSLSEDVSPEDVIATGDPRSDRAG